MNLETTKKFALLSVFYKDGIDTFASELIELGFQIVSSGGTAKFLTERNIPVTDVAKITGNPAMLGHRVVTLDPRIQGGLLALPTKEHAEEREKYGIPWFDLLCVDLYPLAQAIAEGKDDQSVIEMMDIGGPTMISSASKGGRLVICDPMDRDSAITWLKGGGVDDCFKRHLAVKADFVVSEYRMLTARHLGNGEFEALHGTRVAECKGENGPQSPAALYSCGSNDPLAIDNFEMVEGSPLSYNNWCDIDRSLEVIAAAYRGFSLAPNKESGVKIAIGVKHGNPCGASFCSKAECGENAAKAVIEGDPLSIFGGTVITNFIIGTKTANALVHHCTGDGPKRILDVVIAPCITDEAREILRRKNGACRMLENLALGDEQLSKEDPISRIRRVRGGFLAQGNYSFVLDFSDPKLEVNGSLTTRTKEDLILAWAVGSKSNSNTITLVKDGKLIGNGTGQMSRVDAANLAITKATNRGHSVELAVAYSDSFFPFPDGPLVLADAGVRAIFATRGSMRDAEVSSALEEKGVLFVTLPDADARGFFGH